MSFLFTPQQCFIIAIAGFGLLGFWRGWRREVVSLAFALTGVLFLLLKGGAALTQLVFVKMPLVIHDVFSTGPGTTPSQPSSGDELIVTLVTFVVIVVVGYLVGNRAFPGGKNLPAAERLLGILPGLITGYFLITYLSNIFSSHAITLGISTPSETVITNYVPLLIIVAIVVVVLGLIVSRAKKPGASAKK